MLSRPCSLPLLTALVRSRTTAVFIPSGVISTIRPALSTSHRCAGSPGTGPTQTGLSKLPSFSSVTGAAVLVATGVAVGVGVPVGLVLVFGDAPAPVHAV